jgi:hypothetical protein
LNRLPDFVGRRRHVDICDAERTQRIENLIASSEATSQANFRFKHQSN